MSTPHLPSPQPSPRETPFYTPASTFSSFEIAPATHGAQYRFRLRTNQRTSWIWFGIILALIFSICIIVFAIGSVVIYRTVRPRVTPTFEISDGTLESVSFPDSVYYSGKVGLVVNFTNPNHRQDVKIEEAVVHLWLLNNLIAAQDIATFSGKRGVTRLEPVRLVTESFLLPVKDVVELRRQIITNSIDYEVKCSFKVKAKFGFIHYSYWLHGSCHISFNGLPSGSLFYHSCITT